MKNAFESVEGNPSIRSPSPSSLPIPSSKWLSTSEGERKSRKKVLVFDTETAGFNKSIIQLAYVIAYEDNGEELCSKADYLTLTDEKIDYSAYTIHGIDSKLLREKGKCPVEVIHDFLNVVEREYKEDGTRIVAFNAKFDVGRIKYMCEKHRLRYNMEKMVVHCCMKNFAPYCNLKTVNGRQKQPSNKELYIILFEKDPPENLHDALVDVRVTLMNWVEGKKKFRC